MRSHSTHSPREAETPLSYRGERIVRLTLLRLARSFKPLTFQEKIVQLEHIELPPLLGKTERHKENMGTNF